MVDLVLVLAELGLYLLITFWVIRFILGAVGGAVGHKPGGGGGHKGMGVGGHLFVAGVIGTVRLTGQAIRGLVVGFFHHVAPALVRGFAALTERLARHASDRAGSDRPRRQRPERRPRLPRIGVEWPADRHRPARRPEPGDVDSDEWRRAFGGDD